MSMTALQSTKREILNQLVELGGGLVGDDDLRFEGTQFILPKMMDGNIQEAIDFLVMKQQADEKETRMSRTFEYRPWDGAMATWNCMRDYFGAAIGSGFRPEMKTINVGPEETVEIPWGQMAVPGLSNGQFIVGASRDSEKGLLFELDYYGPRKHRPIIQGFFEAVRIRLEEDSIYRGKAIDGKDMPNFIDTSGVNPDKVVYSADVLEQLDASVWSLIEHSEQMRKRGLPLKRSVLFEGPYGTGKSLASMLTAQKAVANGWTFIQCRPGRDDLNQVMSTAQLYQPSVVFFEDVDVVAQGESTDKDSVSELLDVFDGIGAKGTEIMVVLTTNHVEKIHKGMMRPGRLDAVIRIDDLDAAGIEKLVKVTIGEENLDKALEWESIVEAMAGFQPAFVKEASDRSVRYQIARGASGVDLITTADLVAAANGLRPQLDLMVEAGEGKSRPTIDAAFTDMVKGSINGAELLDDDDDAMYRIETAVGSGS